MGEVKIVNYFEVLGVARGAAYPRIVDAYRRLSAENRDTQQPQEEFYKRQAELNNAYTTLSRPIERWKYEAALEASDRLSGQAAGSKPKKGNGSSDPGSRSTMSPRSSSRPTQPAKADDSSVIARIEGLRISQSADSLLALYSIAVDMSYLDDTRSAAGNALVDGYANLRNAEMLFFICVNPMMPEAVRVRAGTEAVGLYKTITIEKDGKVFGMEDMLLSMARGDSPNPAPKDVRIQAGKAAVDALAERKRAYRCAYVASNPISESDAGTIFPPEVCIYARIRINEMGQESLISFARDLNDKARFEMALRTMERRQMRKDGSMQENMAKPTWFRQGSFQGSR